MCNMFWELKTLKKNNKTKHHLHICLSFSLSFSYFLILNTTINWHTHTNRKHTTVREKRWGRKEGKTETVLTSQKSHILLLLSVLLFSLLSLLSLLLYFPLICILSHASLACSLWPLGAASSSADVPALLLPSARWRLSIANQMFFFSPLILGRRLCQVHRGNHGMVL